MNIFDIIQKIQEKNYEFFDSQNIDSVFEFHTIYRFLYGKQTNPELNLLFLQLINKEETYKLPKWFQYRLLCAIDSGKSKYQYIGKTSDKTPLIIGFLKKIYIDLSNEEVFLLIRKNDKEDIENVILSYCSQEKDRKNLMQSLHETYSQIQQKTLQKL